MIPIFVILFYVEFPYHELVAAIVFVLAACTDFLDGYIARKYDLVTNMGKFLDPIADKVLVSTALILLLTRPAAFCFTADVYGYEIVLAGVCVALIMARELIVSGFRLLAVERGLVLAADKLGKIKTTVQDVSIAVLLAVMPFLNGSAGYLAAAPYVAAVGFALLLLATVLTVVSGVNYIVKNRQVLSDKEKN